MAKSTEPMLTPLVVSGGYRIDHFGNVVTTTFVDLREPAARNPILVLVKGCRPEHVIEECGDGRVSTPWEFRNYGENLVGDPNKGCYSETRVLRAAVDDPQDLERAREHNAALNPAGSGWLWGYFIGSIIIGGVVAGIGYAGYRSLKNEN